MKCKDLDQASVSKCFTRRALKKKLDYFLHKKTCDFLTNAAVQNNQIWCKTSSTKMPLSLNLNSIHLSHVSPILKNNTLSRYFAHKWSERCLKSQKRKIASKRKKRQLFGQLMDAFSRINLALLLQHMAPCNYNVPN